MADHMGWIVEAKIADGKRAAFEAIAAEMVAETQKENGTLGYQYFVSDDGDVLILERFADAASAHKHIDTWDKYAERWLEIAPATRMVHLGSVPEDVRARHAALSPKLLKLIDGFTR